MLLKSLTKLKESFLKASPSHLIYFMLAGGLINVAYYSYFFYVNRYLPAPFVWDKDNTFMDFYHPLYWVIKDEFYTTYKSIYPPINYYFLKLFSWNISLDDIKNSFDVRNEYPGLSIFLCLVNLSIVFIVTNIGEWKKIQISNRLILGLTFSLSAPVLFAIERGNLIFFALLFMGLYLSSTNEWFRALFLGILINIKPYFAILLIQYININNFNKSELIKSLFLVALIFIFTSFLVELDIKKFVRTYLFLGRSTVISPGGLLSLPNTLMNLHGIQWVLVYGSGLDTTYSSYAFLFSLIKIVGYIPPLILLMITILRPLSKLEILISALVIITNFSISAGGYVLMFYILLLPFLFESKEYKILIIFIIFIFALPIDWIRVMDVYSEANKSYLGGDLYLGEMNLGLYLGSIIRPICNFSLMTLFIIKLINKYGVFKNRPLVSVKN